MSRIYPTLLSATVLLLLPLLVLLLPAAASAEWADPSPRPYVAAVAQTSRPSDSGLDLFLGTDGEARVLGLPGVEVGVPVWDELHVFARLTSGFFARAPGANPPALKMLEIGGGLTWGHALRPWLVPRLAVSAGATRQQVEFRGGSATYDASTWVPWVSGSAGIEFRSPGFVLDDDDPSSWFGQLSVALYIGYGYTWRGTADFGAAGTDLDLAGTLHGPDLGALDLSGQGADIRLQFRF